jgi:phospholipid transport system substrate-binding protein
MLPKAPCFKRVNSGADAFPGNAFEGLPSPPPQALGLAGGTQPERLLMIDLTRRHLTVTLACAAAASLFGLDARAQATDAAITPVEDFYDALMDAMRHAQALKVQGRYERLEPTMMKSFDVPGMTRAAVGGAFNSFSAADQASLRTAFGRLLVATFASTFDNWKGEKFTIDPAVEPHGADRLVKTQFVNGHIKTDINYLMRNAGQGWKIVDVYLNGNISQLATWRSQYGSVTQSGGPQGLLRAVDAQTTKFMATI